MLKIFSVIVTFSLILYTIWSVYNKKEYINYPFLLFFFFYLLRMGQFLKVEELGGGYELVFIFLVLIFLIVSYNFLPFLFDTWLWQTFFLRLLAIEDWFYRNFPFSFLCLTLYAFSVGAWWSYLGGNSFIYLLFFFLFSFYLQAKKQFLENKLIPLYIEELNDFNKENPSGEDLFKLINLLCFKGFGYKIHNRLSSVLRSKSFPSVGKRFFAGEREAGRTLFNWFVERTTMVYAGVVSILGIAYNQNREDARKEKEILTNLHKVKQMDLDVEIQEIRNDLKKCISTQNLINKTFSVKGGPCESYLDLVTTKADLLFEQAIHEYGSSFDHAKVDKNKLLAQWVASSEREEAIQYLLSFNLKENLRYRLYVEQHLKGKVFPAIIQNYENGFLNSQSSGWETIPPCINPELSSTIKKSIKEAFDQYKLKGKKFGFIPHSESNSENVQFEGPRLPALPPTTKAPSVSSKDEFILDKIWEFFF